MKFNALTNATSPEDIDLKSTVSTVKKNYPFVNIEEWKVSREIAERDVLKFFFLFVNAFNERLNSLHLLRAE